MRDQLEVNYLGVVALTKLVLPGMRERGHGRVVTVTSVGGAVGQPFADAYCGAKFAVEGFMQSLAVVAERFGVWVIVIEPAAVASDFVANVQRPTHADDPYAALLGRLRRAHPGRLRQRPERGRRRRAPSPTCATATSYAFRWQTSPRRDGLRRHVAGRPRRRAGARRHPHLDRLTGARSGAGFRRRLSPLRRPA